MEPQAQQQLNEDVNAGSDQNMKGGSSICRQNSTRWTPTSEPIRMLKELYYNNGIKSPTTDQIQRISARLRQYGKIEGKNVFYWFQNHKARERQKKKFTSEHRQLPMQKGRSVLGSNINGGNNSKGAQESSETCPDMVGGGQIGYTYYGYGSFTMEKNFGDCSISEAGSMASTVNGGTIISPNLGFLEADIYSSVPYSFFDNRKSTKEFEGRGHDHHEQVCSEIETLPLFPMQVPDHDHRCRHRDHEDVIDYFCNTKPRYDGYYPTSGLELSLNSFSDISDQGN